MSALCCARSVPEREQNNTSAIVGYTSERGSKSFGLSLLMFRSGAPWNLTLNQRVRS